LKYQFLEIITKSEVNMNENTNGTSVPKRKALGRGLADLMTQETVSETVQVADALAGVARIVESVPEAQFENILVALVNIRRTAQGDEPTTTDIGERLYALQRNRIQQEAQIRKPKRRLFGLLPARKS